MGCYIDEELQELIHEFALGDVSSKLLLLTPTLSLLPLTFPFPSLIFPPFRNRAPFNQLGGLVSAVSASSRVRSG